MTPSASVIVPVSGGGRSLLRTTDSIARQGTGVELLLVVADTASSSPLVESVTVRLHAAVVESSGGPGAALNSAIRRAEGDCLLIVPCGFALPRGFVERCVVEMQAAPAVAALVPPFVLHTADGQGGMDWIPDGVTAAAALADPQSIPPVLVLRRAVWSALGGFDEALPALAEYEFWLRLLLGGQMPRRLDAPGVRQEIPARPAHPADDRDHLTALRLVLARHAQAIESEMDAVLVAREVRFGRLRETHRGLIAERDAGLAELDRLRALTADHSAYLRHHGRAALDWGDLRRTDPVSRDWGYDRGVPIDRHYIEAFLAAHSSDIAGSVLEVQEDDFTRRFGGARVTASDVLDIDAGNARATILADLRCAPNIPDGTFNCIILTQTLHVIDDMRAALLECYRILAPGGVLLATFPAASRVCLEYGEDGDLWRLTPAGARALVESVCAPAEVSCDSFGNVLTNVAFLAGLACADLTDAEFAAVDPYYPALTGVRARKPAPRPLRPGRPAPDHSRGVVLLYHRIDDRDDIHQLGVPPALFDSHLQWLTERCSVVPLDELLAAAPGALPDRAVALTFDDGYLDNLETAAPLLQRHGLPATFFVTTRWLDAPGEYWWDALERVLLGSTPGPSFLDLTLRGVARRLPTGSAEERLASHWVLHEALVHADLAERGRVMDTIIHWSGGGRPRHRPMVTDEVRALAARSGVTIGAHTVHHLALPDQPAETRVTEVQESLARLACILDRPPASFAYPYGAIDQACLSLVRESCRWGVVCEDVGVGASFDAARVPRVDVKRWDTGTLDSRLGPLFAAAPMARRRAFTPGR